MMHEDLKRGLEIFLPRWHSSCGPKHEILIWLLVGPGLVLARRKSKAIVTLEIRSESMINHMTEC